MLKFFLVLWILLNITCVFYIGWKLSFWNNHDKLSINVLEVVYLTICFVTPLLALVWFGIMYCLFWVWEEGGAKLKSSRVGKFLKKDLINIE
ncbi:MAG: hypothetical protein GOVbin4162_132 [Prokaryotic dsDNA virus sp.]|nr:MAG: hypothetical protein GOVbin4162_132 [Prokaryotic dsDNA virus sp.]